MTGLPCLSKPWKKLFPDLSSFAQFAGLTPIDQNMRRWREVRWRKVRGGGEDESV